LNVLSVGTLSDISLHSLQDIKRDTINFGDIRVIVILAYINYTRADYYLSEQRVIRPYNTSFCVSILGRV